MFYNNFDAQDDRSGGCFWPTRIAPVTQTPENQPLFNLESNPSQKSSAHENPMRMVINPQLTLGEIDIPNIVIDPKSRDDIPQLLKGLQFIDTNEPHHTWVSLLPNPSAIKESTRVFKLTPSCFALAASRMCIDLGKRCTNLPGSPPLPGDGTASPNSRAVRIQL